LLIDRPLRERAQVLDELLTGGRKVVHHGDTEAQSNRTQGKLTFDSEEEISAASVIRAPVFFAGTPKNWKGFFVAARPGATKD